MWNSSVELLNCTVDSKTGNYKNNTIVADTHFDIITGVKNAKRHESL